MTGATVGHLGAADEAAVALAALVALALAGPASKLAFELAIALTPGAATASASVADCFTARSASPYSFRRAWAPSTYCSRYPAARAEIGHVDVM
jgi:hypothetical protein